MTELPVPSVRRSHGSIPCSAVGICLAMVGCSQGRVLRGCKCSTLRHGSWPHAGCYSGEQVRALVSAGLVCHLGSLQPKRQSPRVTRQRKGSPLPHPGACVVCKRVSRRVCGPERCPTELAISSVISVRFS